jgi:hypothetical protein
MNDIKNFRKIIWINLWDAEKDVYDFLEGDKLLNLKEKP